MKISNWVILNFANSYDNEVATFGAEFVRIGAIHGMNIAPHKDCLKPARRNINEQEATTMFELAVTKYKPLELIVFFLQGTTPAYNVVKTLGDLKYGIATQGVEARNVRRINDQTISNILLKVNTKLGGRNFLLSPRNQL